MKPTLRKNVPQGRRFAAPITIGRVEATGAFKNARAGLSLIEVLVSIFVLLFGLLGVAAMIPVGGHYFYKAEEMERGSELAEAAMAQLTTRGLLDPQVWMYPTINPADLTPGEITDIRRAWVANPANGTRPFGFAYVLDPLGVSKIQETRDDNGKGVSPKIARFFPKQRYAHTWNNFLPTTGNSADAMNQWPVRRLTLSQNGSWINSLSAEKVCTLENELTAFFPDKDSDPVQVIWELDAAGRPISKKTIEGYSWIATIMPANKAAQEKIVSETGSGEAAYEISTVVMRSRKVRDADEINDAELLVTASVLSTGLNGGQLLLKTSDSAEAEKLGKNLKTGEWIMLCGPHPSSTPNFPKFILRWYRVVAKEEETAADGTADPSKSIITVRGAEWPWQPAGKGSNALSNNLRVGVFSGVVSVHTKTMRLEANSQWSMK